MPPSTQDEGVQVIEPLAPGRFEEDLRQTLLCFVLVDPDGKHSFCSRYDLGPWPLLPGISHLPPTVLQVHCSLVPSHLAVARQMFSSTCLQQNPTLSVVCLDSEEEEAELKPQY